MEDHQKPIYVLEKRNGYYTSGDVAKIEDAKFELTIINENEIEISYSNLLNQSYEGVYKIDTQVLDEVFKIDQFFLKMNEINMYGFTAVDEANPIQHFAITLNEEDQPIESIFKTTQAYELVEYFIYCGDTLQEALGLLYNEEMMERIRFAVCENISSYFSNTFEISFEEFIHEYITNFAHFTNDLIVKNCIDHLNHYSTYEREEIGVSILSYHTQIDENSLYDSFYTLEKYDKSIVKDYITNILGYNMINIG